MKTVEQERALYLRSVEGRSIKEIAQAVGISQSSASIWVRDIELSETQRTALVERARERRNKSRSAHFRARRLSAQAHGRRLARAGEPGYAAGCMLYWAEGSKSRNAAQFVNSDPEMVRFFADFMRTHYGVSDEQFRLHCNLFADHVERQREIEQFWLDALGVPANCLRKSTVNVYSNHSQKKRQNKLPYGTVRLTVHSTHVIQSIYGAIQEYAGFERQEWLG